MFILCGEKLELYIYTMSRFHASCRIDNRFVAHVWTATAKELSINPSRYPKNP